MRRCTPQHALLCLLLAMTGVAWLTASAAAASQTPRLAPELPRLTAERWVNSPPLTLTALRGRPVLIEFWTFGCHNCRNTLPWLERVYERYAPQGLAIIAVHTPEFDRERDRAAVSRAVMRLGIPYPVLIDNDYAYWRALDNQYWPAFYLIDGDGRIVATHIGELHAGQRAADAFEAEIVQRLPSRPSAANRSQQVMHLP